MEQAVHSAASGGWQTPAMLARWVRYIAQQEGFLPTWQALHHQHPIQRNPLVFNTSSVHKRKAGEAGDPSGEGPVSDIVPPEAGASNSGPDEVAARTSPTFLMADLHAQITRFVLKPDGGTGRGRLPSPMEVAACSVAATPQQLWAWIREGVETGVPDLRYAYTTVLVWYRSQGNVQVRPPPLVLSL